VRTALVALALVSCASPARAPEPSRPGDPAGSAAEQGAHRSDGVAPIPTVHAARDIVEAPHGGIIVTLALSPDGQVALSADELGGVRLWPSLDGTREPRIVEMPIPKQLAIGRRTGGLMAAALDEAGGLYIAKLDAEGRQLAHATLPAEPPIAGMATSGERLVTWRSDQTFVVHDADGAIKDKLGTEARQRIVAVAVNGPRAVVLLDREGTKRQARWLTLEPKLAWGAWIKLDQELLGTVDLALAPGGNRLAATLRTDRTSNGIVFELAKGKAVASGVFNSITADIGFVDDDHVALGGFEGLAWIDLTVPNAKPTAMTPTSPGTRTQAVLGTGGGRAVTAMNGELAIATPTSTHYLGYDTVAPRIAEVGRDGHLLVGVADHLLLLDRDLRVKATPLPSFTGTAAELRWLGEGDWLLESSSPQDATLQIQLITEAGGAEVVRKGLKEVQILHYEPSTQLVTLSFGASSEIARFDRKTRKLEHVASVKKASPYEHALFVPVAPALARDTKLVQVAMRDRSTVKWFRDPSALDKPAASVTLEGAFAAADAAGQVYMWRNTPAGLLELVVFADGKPLHVLPNSGPIAVWPDPTGKRYVEVARSSVALYDISGKQLWFQQLATSQEALWLTDGGIAIISAGGVARLDPSTGAVTAARCGWRFGLATKPHPPSPRVEPLCAQLRR
jgi:hypothetical protein